MVRRFAVDGRRLQSFGRRGTGPGEFTTPHAVYVNQSNRVLVAYRENDGIQLFEREGRHFEEWGDFYHPMDVYEDRAGRIYVSDQIPGLSQLWPAGQLIGRCRPCYNTPHGVWGAPDARSSSQR